MRIKILHPDLVKAIKASKEFNAEEKQEIIKRLKLTPIENNNRKATAVKRVITQYCEESRLSAAIYRSFEGLDSESWEWFERLEYNKLIVKYQKQNRWSKWLRLISGICILIITSPIFMINIITYGFQKSMIKELLNQLKEILYD